MNRTMAAVLGGLTLTGCMPATPPTTIPGPTTDYLGRIKQYGAVLTNLFGVNGDQRTVVNFAGVAYPPGTILVPGAGDVQDICAIPATAFLAPDPPVQWTPPIGSEKQFSLSFTVPGIAGLASAGAKLNAGSAVNLDLENITAHVALLSPFEQALNGPDCKPKITAALAQGKTVTVIRGSVSAQESFSLTQDPSAAANLDIPKVGGFDVTYAPDKVSVSLTESAPSIHFLVTYNIAPPSTAPTAVLAAAPAPEAAATPAAEAVATPPPAAPAPVRYVPAPEVVDQLAAAPAH